MNRKKFLINTSKVIIAAVGGASLGFSKVGKTNNVEVVIPLPIQVVIDDVGWWNGKNGSANNEPYRTGINRNHVVADYQAIIDLGKALNIRPQAAMVLSEWDREDILKNVPHSTYMGKDWHNKWVGPWLDETAELINKNREYIEITVHGIGHEWWGGDKFTRAEWADLKTGIMRNGDDVKRHLDAFHEIMKQNNLGTMPTSFVPAAFAHGFGVTKGNKESMAQILKSRGFTYINTIFSIPRKKIMGNLDKVQYENFGVDDGILTINRGHDITRWNEIRSGSELLFKNKSNAKVDIGTCGMHWPNLLHENPEKNSTTVAEWVKFLSAYNNNLDTMLARNSIEFQKQFVHQKLTTVKIINNEIILDFSKVKKVGTVLPNDELIIKISSNKELAFSSKKVKSLLISSQNEDGRMLYKIKLKPETNSNYSVIKFS